MVKFVLSVLCVLLALHLNEAVGQYPQGGARPKSPVRINPYVMKYLQGYYKKHKTLPPALKRWAYQQLQKRNPSAPPSYSFPAQQVPVAPVQQVYQAPVVAAAPVQVQYAPAPVQTQYSLGAVYNPAPAPVVAPATPVASQAKSGYGQPQQMSYQPPQQMSYKPPQMSYKPPQMAYKPPQMAYKPPQMSYTPPRMTYQQPKPQSYGDQCLSKVNPGWCSGKYAGHYTMSGSSSCYIQCDQWGRAYGKPCAPGTSWRFGGQEPTHYNHCI